ncbi:MAG: hypothetical protein LUD77_10970 [Clostridiales bacterium]|nr:hypothetical protein [Clostridiales bacterium]
MKNMKLIKKGCFEDAPNMPYMLDLLLSDKDFHTAPERAVEWIQNENDDIYDY